jgi:nucleoside diphosphate kinase
VPNTFKISSHVLNEERSENQREGMFQDLVHWFLCTNISVLVLEIEKRRKEKNSIGVGSVQPNSAQSGTPDCTMVYRTVSGAPG